MYTTLTGKNIGYSLFSSTYGNGPDSYYKVGNVDVPSAPATTFCFKADYAESSGAHNTGFARLANDAMKSADPIIQADINPNENTGKTPP
jgi:hypothetical protein